MAKDSIGSDGLQFPGLILYWAARATGNRVTSGKRTSEENDGLPGASPTSKHLEGLAIDHQALDPIPNAFSLGVLHFLSARGGFHSKGTREHYHWEADETTVLKFGATLLVLWLVFR